MIIENGYIRLLKKEGEGGFDENGNPIEAEVKKGGKIPCQYRNTSLSLKGRNDVSGAYTIQRYEILIQTPSYIPFVSEELYLYDLNDNEIGKFSIESIENLYCVDLIKIIV